MSEEIREHASVFLDVVDRLGATIGLQQTPVPPLWRPRQRQAYLAAPRRYDALLRERNRRARALQELGAGSAPGVWGPLSVIGHGRISLENTLERVSDDPRALELSRMMPELRARAAIESADRSIQSVDDRLVEIVGLGPLMESPRAALWDFISTERRPQPELAWHLMRTHKLVNLILTDGDEWEDLVPTIVLGNISTRGLQGHGIGTAALRELCRYADAKQLLIRANIEPLKREDPAFQRLAAWYHRHGFAKASCYPGSGSRATKCDAHRTARQRSNPSFSVNQD